MDTKGTNVHALIWANKPQCLYAIERRSGDGSSMYVCSLNYEICKLETEGAECHNYNNYIKGLSYEYEQRKASL